MRPRTLALAAGLLCSLVLVVAAQAQVREKEKVNIVATGDIIAIDVGAQQLTVKSTLDEGLVYQVDAAATILKGSAKLALSDLQVGWNVAMNGHRTGDTRLVTYIKVVNAP
jgi:hypothetical protein